MTLQTQGSVVPIQENDNIFFTLFRSNKPVVKTYKADFSKTIAANMYRANYYLQSVPSLKDFDTYLNALSAYDTITLGVTQKKSGLSLTAKEFREGKECIYRGKQHLKYCNEVYHAS